MRPLLAITLLLIAGALLAREIAAEAALILHPQPFSLSPSSVLLEDRRETGREAAFRMPAAERYAAIGERPLFSKSRRPYAPPVEPKAAPAPPAPLNAVLQGIVGNGDARLALIAFNGSQRAERLAAGDSHGAWTVSEITTDGVVLTRGSESAVLRLGFATRN